MRQRKKTNSAKVNLIISLAFHSLAIGALFFFASREGMLGKRLKEITVSIAPKQKKPEVEKPKPAEPKVEAPKVAEVKPVAPPVVTAAAPPPTAEAPPAVAPPSVELPAFSFQDGAKDIITSTDEKDFYKQTIERTVRAHWNRPEDLRDDNYVADVELQLDKAGQVKEWRWVKGSGDKHWDDSVKQALAATKAISRPPPPNFPAKVIVRFDVEASTSETPLSLSSR